MEKISVSSAWNRLFEEYSIVGNVDSEGIFRISADQIRKYKEPRLMTKFDESYSMPKIFRDNKLNILSISNGEYLIGRFSIFESLNYDEESKTYAQRAPELESLDKSDLYSEGSALLMAYNSGILQDAFETEDLYFTMFGRMRAKSFSFKVNSIDKTKQKRPMQISVNGSQMEIDAGFESEDKIFIIEAKNKHVEEINLRQLYYPFKLWSEKVSKPVIPVFLVYTDDTYYIHIGQFTDEENINSFEITDSKKYVLSDSSKITTEDIKKEFESIKDTAISKHPFPQANSFLKVIDLLKMIKDKGYVKKNEVTEFFNFTERQTDYYVTAAAFIGLITRNRRQRNITFTDLGRKMMDEPYRKRHMDLTHIIMSDKVFYDCFKFYYDKGEMPSLKFVESKIREYYFDEEKNEKDTGKRRASTVIAWMKSIFNLAR